MKIKTTQDIVNIKAFGFIQEHSTENAILFRSEKPANLFGQDLLNIDNGKNTTATFYPQFWVPKKYVETTKTTIKVPLWTITSNYSLAKEKV